MRAGGVLRGLLGFGRGDAFRGTRRLAARPAGRPRGPRERAAEGAPAPYAFGLPRAAPATGSGGVALRTVTAASGLLRLAGLGGAGGGRAY